MIRLKLYIYYISNISGAYNKNVITFMTFYYATEMKADTKLCGMNTKRDPET